MISLLCFAHCSLVNRFHDVFLGVGDQLEHRQEILFSQNGHSARGYGADGSVSRFLADQCHLSEVLSGGEPGEYLLGSVFLACYCKLTAVNKIGAVAFLTLPENHLSGLGIFDLKQTVAPQKSVRYNAKNGRCAEHHEHRCNCREEKECSAGRVLQKYEREDK